MSGLFVVHLLSCFFMAGVIWMVQVLVYPFFQFVGEKEFQSLHEFHMKKITWVVAPVMTIELMTGAALLYFQQDSLFFWNFLSVGIVWLLTIFINVPAHNELKFISEISKFNLVRKNWPRTTIWTLRSILLSYLLIAQPARLGL